MAAEIVMPQMGAEMEEGTLIRWLKQPGDHVARGETIGEIETDKATVDLESFEEGTFERAVVEEGTKVPVGEVVAYILRPGESASANAPAAAGAPPSEAPSAAPAAPSQPLTAPSEASSGQRPPSPAASPAPPGANGGTAPGRRLRASPVARRLAAERGVDLALLKGSGPEGRITRRDVEAADRSPGPFPPREGETRTDGGTTGAAAPTREADTTRARETAPVGEVRPAGDTGAAAQPMSRMRQAIARRMAQSKREAPHYYVTVDVDMTAAMSARAEVNAAGAGFHLTVNDLLIKAAALALSKYPAFNASYDEQGLIAHEQINICIGVAVPDGLIAPALLDCGRKSLGEIVRGARDLTERTRNGGLRPAELSDGSFTISNLGAYGVETLIAIIQPPQAAIIGAGMVESQPVVRDGQIVVREMLKLALSADHRVTDGAQGAEFMREVKSILEAPLRLAL